MRFPTTHWTELFEATRNPRATGYGALESLCERYKEPVLQFIRTRWYREVPGPEDLAQDFFLKLVESRMWRNADRNRGRFRTFLAVALSNYIKSMLTAMNSLKRGGGIPPVSLDEMLDNGGEPPSCSPEDQLEIDRAWALSRLARAVQSVRAAASDPVRFEHLLACVQGRMDAAAAAAATGLNQQAVRTAISRLRKELREALEKEIAGTVWPADFEDEMQYIRSLLMGSAAESIRSGN